MAMMKFPDLTVMDVWSVVCAVFFVCVFGMQWWLWCAGAQVSSWMDKLCLDVEHVVFLQYFGLS